MKTTINTARWQSVVKLTAMFALVAPMIAACGGGGLGATVKRDAFSSKEYGVKSSPRVTNNPNPPKGGGRYQVGKPYTVRGKVYTPKEDPNYRAEGTASWYGSDFHGRRTANGEIFSANSLTGAHPTLPLPSYVRVTNRTNGRSVVVRVNDRGPYVSGRVMDLSHRAAEMLGYVNAGHADVDVQYVAPAPLEGDDTRMLVATYDGPPIAAPASSNNSLVGMAGGFFGSMFSYADGDAGADAANSAVLNAHDAATAMATRSSALDNWVKTNDQGALAIKLELGVFTNAQSALEIAERFAVLAAVDEENVTLARGSATRLTLSHLKPGVERADVLALARELGLNDIVLY